jgi:hypothetical protein
LDIKFSFNAVSTTPASPVQISLNVNNEVISAAALTDTPHSFAFVFSDTQDKSYDVEIIMSGKIDPDTQVVLSDLKFDSYVMDNLFIEQFATYHHNFNGTGDNVSELFTPVLGCDGVIKFTFITPIYQWLLSNMIKTDSVLSSCV